jgi:hypothetical protein
VPLTIVGEQSGECMVYVLYRTADNSATYLGEAIDFIAMGEIGEWGSKFLNL